VWFHVAISWSTADRTIRLFQDFEEVGSRVLPVARISFFFISSFPL
jgi:hypothetical protein